MRKMMLAFGALSLLAPAAIALPSSKAEAKSFDYSSAQNRRHAKKKNYKYREWRQNGRTYCRKSDGTTGLVVGAVGGALVGRTIDTHGDRSAGTLLGAVAGGLAGREIDRGGSNNRRCR